MTTIKYNIGDIVRRKISGKEYLIEKIELGYYTLSDSDCPSYFPSCDLSCSTLDNAKKYAYDAMSKLGAKNINEEVKQAIINAYIKGIEE